MKDVQLLKEILPINLGNYKLNHIDINDIYWYVENCKKDYFNEYIDFQFNNTKNDMLHNYLCNVVNSYNNNIDSKEANRLVLKDLNNNIVAGISIENSNENLELSYWVLPEYQNKGIGTTLLTKVTEELFKSKLKFKRTMLRIQEVNTRSMRCAEKSGYKLYSDYKGVRCNIKVYFMDRYK